MSVIKRGLTSFQLKIIALIIMTIDHFGAYKLFTDSPGINVYMRITGRIAAPIFLFLLIEGLKHTRGKKKYILRLYIAAVSAEFIRLFFEIRMGNIFQTFFYAALFIVLIDAIIKKRIGEMHRAAIFMIIAALLFLFEFLPDYLILRIFFPSPLTVEYSYIFILLAVVWYFINNKYINCAVFAGLSVIYYIFIQALQSYMILALPFMLLYNGEKGRSGLKYLFYIYYPAHQILFFYASVYLLNRQ